VRYRISGHEIRSENAAKPILRASKRVVDWLFENVQGGAVLDYGCGKLRYAKFLAEQCACLTLVDSKEQVDRLQMIDGEKTTVREYVSRRWDHANVFTIEEFRSRRDSYYFILCANVLSAIPCAAAQNAAVRRIARSLSGNGQALFITQFRNSGFKKMARLPRAMPHLDGWILQTSKGMFYYGLLPLRKLEGLVTLNECCVDSAWTEGESAFLLAKRTRPTPRRRSPNFGRWDAMRGF